MDYFKYIKLDPVNYYILYDIEDLKKIKKNISKEELKKLENDLSYINVPFKKESRSVIYKKIPLKDVSKKDYVSLATYYWKNENTNDGLPYILKDGLANPEGDFYDKNNLRYLAFVTYYQAILYYLSDDKKYLNILEDNINYYFLDEVTGMNPNMNHAQLIKGINDGRGIGMIDFTANMSYALYMIKILHDDHKIDEKFYKSLCDWLEKFYHWYKFSPIALEEKYAKNNHGIFYDFGLIILMDFLNKKDEILSVVYQMIELRLKTQINKNVMDLELKRTKSKNYSLMAIKGIYDFSKISSKYNFDLYKLNKWYYNKVDININNVCLYLYDRLVLKNKNWDYEQIIDFDEATLLPLIYEESKYDIQKIEDIKYLDNKHLYVDLQLRLIKSIFWGK